MNKKTFDNCFNRAKRVYWDVDSIACFDGFALPGQEIVATEDQVAKLIRYQAMQLNGNWDNAALLEIKNAKRITVIEEN